jgi:hypothetical protein
MKHGRMVSIAVAISLLVQFFPAYVRAEPFTVLKSTTWNGFVSMPEGFYVAPGAVLTITPGTIIKLGGNVGVKGRIKALGNSAEPIIFTSTKDKPQPGDWGYMEFQTTDGVCEFSYCNFMYGGKGGFGMLKIGAPTGMDDRIRLDGCYISNSASQGIWIAKANPVIAGCTISNCSDPAKGAGIWIQEGSNPSISATLIENCSMAIKSDLDSNPSMLGIRARNNKKNAMVMDSGTVSKNVVWDCSIPYLLEKQIVVAKSGTINVMPGNTIKMNVSISVADGSLNFRGTETEPITVTSVFDDSVGGDVYGDGQDKMPQAGDWGQIEFQTQSLPSTLSYVNLYYGGGRVDENSGYGIIKFGAAGGVDDRIKLYNCNIAHSKTTGLWFQASSPSLFNCTVSDCRNEEFGAAVWLMSKSRPLLWNCKLTDCKYAIYTDGDSYAASSGLTVENNQFNCIYFGERYESLLLDGDIIWNSELVHYIPKTIGIQPTGVLRLMPGIIVKYSGIIRVDGRLVAIGTKTKPVVFTSLKDDTYGGDTNGDKGFEEPKPGDNQGIQFISSRGKSILSNCIIKYGGEGGNGNVYFGQDKNVKNEQVMDNCVISHSLNQGIKCRKSNVDIINCLISDCMSKNTGFAIQMENESFVRMVDCKIERTMHLFDMTPECSFKTKNIASNQIGEELIGGYGGIHINKTLGKKLTKDTIWNAEYPFILEDDFYIDKGVILTIEKGNVVKFPKSFYVYGTLNCPGTETDPIYFTSVHDDSVGGDSNLNGKQSLPRPGDHGQVEFNGSIGECTINHVVFRYGGSDMNLGSVKIGGNTGVDGRLKMNNVTVEESTTQGFYFQNSSPEMRNIIVKNCRGQEQLGSAFYVMGKSDPDIMYANISDCTWAAWNNMLAGGDLTLRNVWFGDESGPTDPEGNPEGKGLPVKGSVSYKPFETKPVSTAGAGGKAGVLPPYKKPEPYFESPLRAPDALQVTPIQSKAAPGTNFTITAQSGKAPYSFKSLDESICRLSNATDAMATFTMVGYGAAIIQVSDAGDQIFHVWVSNPAIISPEPKPMLKPSAICVRVGQVTNLKLQNYENPKILVIPGQSATAVSEAGGDVTVYAFRSGEETVKVMAGDVELTTKVCCIADEGQPQEDVWDFRIAPGDGKARLMWKLPNIQKRTFEGVVLTMNGNPLTELGPEQTNYTVGGLKNGTTYTFGIRGRLGGQLVSKTCKPGKLPITLVLWIGKPEAVINGANTTIDKNKAIVPTIIGNSTMVPFRFIGEALGAEVGWVGETKEVGFWTPKADIKIYIGKKSGTNFGVPITVNPAPQIIAGKTFIPLRAVSELLGAKVAYEAKTKKITISYDMPWSPTW